MASNDYYELYRRSRPKKKAWLLTKMARYPDELHREHINTLYRHLSIGLTLVDTLDDMVNEGRIEPQLAMKVVARFDRAVAEVLAEKVKARMTFKGHLDTYRFCDEVWTFLIKDVNFKLDGGTSIQAEKVKIVSCNAKKPGET